MTTLRDVNTSLLELTKETARNQMAVKILVAVFIASFSGGLSLMAGLVVWILKGNGGN